MHAVHFFLSVLGLNELVTAEVINLFPVFQKCTKVFKQTTYTEQDCFSGIIAAAIHDLDHPGYNNAYMINTSSNLALRYNDQCVLESYHCSKAFEIMQSDPHCNILSKFSLDKWKAIRSSIVSMVLATDMANHFEYIAKFENKINGTGKTFFNFYYIIEYIVQ